MRIFKQKSFHQWAKSEKLSDRMLKQAIDEIEKDLYEANLGSNLYKKRIASPGKGKRGGYRTLIAFKTNEKAFFLYGFAKNVRDNIDEKEQRVYRKLARDMLAMSAQDIQKLVNDGKLFEVI